MPLTKAQKAAQIENAGRLLKESTTLVFVDFTGTPVEEMRKLRADLRAIGASLSVVKKRLLALALKAAGIELDPRQFASQVGTVFATGDISGPAGAVYRFSKGKERFAILGAYTLAGRTFLDADAVVAIGKLPSREVLLGQVVGGLSAPLRVLLYMLNGRKEQLAHG